MEMFAEDHTYIVEVDSWKKYFYDIEMNKHIENK